MKTSISLLNRVKADPKSEAWERMVDIYGPLISHWLRRSGVDEDDVSDLCQEVLFVLTQGIEGFDHNGRNGAFRNWLRMIAVNRMRRHWRSKKKSVQQTADSDSVLDQLEDPNSSLTRKWDEEHDRYVLNRILQMVKNDFEDKVLETFCRLTVQGQTASQVASDLGITKANVYKYKFRVMQRLLLEAKGLIDSGSNPLSESGFQSFSINQIQP